MHAKGIKLNGDLVNTPRGLPIGFPRPTGITLGERAKDTGSWILNLLEHSMLLHKGYQSSGR